MSIESPKHNFNEGTEEPKKSPVSNARGEIIGLAATEEEANEMYRKNQEEERDAA